MSRLMEDLPSFPSRASVSQENNEGNSGSTSSKKLRVTLLSSEWRSTKGGLSTLKRELAIQLAKHPSVEVSVYLPRCSEEDKKVAGSHNVTLIEAEEMAGLKPDFWLSCLPEDHAVDWVMGHGVVLGRQVQILKRTHHFKWIQVVHTAPEELGMHKSYADAISRGEKKHQTEVKLCEKADQVVAVGPKLTDAFSGYLRTCGKDQDVFNLTPGIFSEFADVTQATKERETFSVLVIGRGGKEDFQLKGYDIAARAIAELKDEPQPYKLLFVGAPSGEEENVKDLLLQQGIDHSQLTVRCFNESREQLARLFCEADLVIMPSRTEGFGLAALEALTAGLPVLVSRNSGLGEALKKVPFASSCVIQSEDPKDWASAIKAVRGKDRKLRLKEAEVLRGGYAEMYSWQDHCNRLVARMLAISQGPTADEQNLSTKAAVVCQEEKPPPSEKRLHKGENLVIRIDFDTREQGASPTQNVNLEEKVVTKIYPSTQEVMNLITAERFKTINPSNPQEVNGFLQYMKEVRQLLIVDVKTGSLIIKVQTTSLHVLDELWRDYCTGHLTEVAQKYLVTEDILKELRLDSVQLTVTINEEEYRAYRKHLLRNEEQAAAKMLKEGASLITKVRQMTGGIDEKLLVLPSKAIDKLMSQPFDSREVVIQLKDCLKLDEVSLENPGPETKRLIRCLANKAKQSNRPDVVRELREVTPAGTAGPLLPECLDVMNIPTSQIQRLTVHLSGGQEWKQLAEKLGLAPHEIRFLDNRVLNPCEAAIAFIARQRNITVGELYDKICECELPLVADIL